MPGDDENTEGTAATETTAPAAEPEPMATEQKTDVPVEAASEQEQIQVPVEAAAETAAEDPAPAASEAPPAEQAATESPPTEPIA